MWRVSHFHRHCSKLSFNQLENNEEEEEEEGGVTFEERWPSGSDSADSGGFTSRV